MVEKRDEVEAEIEVDHLLQRTFLTPFIQLIFQQSLGSGIHGGGSICYLVAERVSIEDMKRTFHWFTSAQVAGLEGLQRQAKPTMPSAS